MPSTRDKLIFTHAMARHTRATVRQCEALMRYAATLQRLAEDDCNVPANDAELARREAKRSRIQRKVIELTAEIIGYNAQGKDDKAIIACFQNDPRDAVLKIRVPSGFTNDFGGDGICVPS